VPRCRARPHALASLTSRHAVHATTSEPACVRGPSAPTPAHAPAGALTCRPAAQIRTLCLSPDGRLLLAIDEDGRALLINRRRRVLLHRFAFKAPVAAARFSPDGRFIGAAVGRLLQVRPALRAALHSRRAVRLPVSTCR